jgi:hypothetical protein
MKAEILMTSTVMSSITARVVALKESVNIEK